VTKEVADDLDLPVVGTVNLILAGATGCHEAKDYDVVQLLIRLGDRNRQVLAIVRDRIDTTFHTPGLVKAVKRLRENGIRLADQNIASDKVGGIHILIGADYYGRFIYGLTRKLGIDLLKTTGGHLIYGEVKSDSEAGSASLSTVMVAEGDVLPVPGTRDMVEGGMAVHKSGDMNLTTIGSNHNALSERNAMYKPRPEEIIEYQRDYLTDLREKHYGALPAYSEEKVRPFEVFSRRTIDIHTGVTQLRGASFEGYQL